MSSKKNKAFTIVGTDINHGVLQQTVIAEIMNNAIGNPACLKKLPPESLDNDMMHLHMTQLVSPFFQSHECI